MRGEYKCSEGSVQQGGRERSNGGARTNKQWRQEGRGAVCLNLHVLQAVAGETKALPQQEHERAVGLRSLSSLSLRLAKHETHALQHAVLGGVVGRILGGDFKDGWHWLCVGVHEVADHACNDLVDEQHCHILAVCELAEGLLNPLLRRLCGRGPGKARRGDAAGVVMVRWAVAAGVVMVVGSWLAGRAAACRRPT